METVFRRIRLIDGSAYYAGEPISLADAQVMVNEDIAKGTILAGSYLRIDGSELVIEPAPLLAGDDAGGRPS